MNISTARSRLAKELPLLISNVQWSDPVLVVGGSDWSLAITSPWRLISFGKMMLGSDQAGPDSLSFLAGKKLISCDAQSKHVDIDVALFIEGGVILEIFSVSNLEPWTLSMHGAMIYVSSPSAGSG